MRQRICFLLIFILVISLKLDSQLVCTVVSYGDTVWHSEEDVRNHIDVCTNGLRVVLSEKRSIIMEGCMEGCRLNGFYARYWENGELRESGIFINDVKTGVWSNWNSNGTLIARRKW